MTAKRIMLVSALGWGLVFLVLLKSLHAEKAMGVPQYATKRSVKVCAESGVGQACGTGSFIGKGIILTENHIIKDMEYIGIDTSNPNVLIEKTSPTQKVMVLRSDSQAFEPAIVVTKDSDKDLAILSVSTEEANSEIILNFEFRRGEEVWAIGNPNGQDFLTIKTKIVGVWHFNYHNGVERDLIEFDSKDNKIRAGFSGGGIYNLNGGLIGILEMCSEEVVTCIAIPAKDLQTYLSNKNKEKK